MHVSIFLFSRLVGQARQALGNVNLPLLQLAEELLRGDVDIADTARIRNFRVEDAHVRQFLCNNGQKRGGGGMRTGWKVECPLTKRKGDDERRTNRRAQGDWEAALTWISGTIDQTKKLNQGAEGEGERRQNRTRARGGGRVEGYQRNAGKMLTIKSLADSDSQEEKNREERKYSPKKKYTRVLACHTRFLFLFFFLLSFQCCYYCSPPIYLCIAFACYFFPDPSTLLSSLPQHHRKRKTKRGSSLPGSQ